MIQRSSIQVSKVDLPIQLLFTSKQVENLSEIVLVTSQYQMPGLALYQMLTKFRTDQHQDLQIPPIQVKYLLG